jgi:hypothetical protein
MSLWMMRMLCQQKDLPNPGKLWILENLGKASNSSAETGQS